MLAMQGGIQGGATDWIIGVLFLSVLPAIPALMSKRAEPSSRGGGSRALPPGDGPSDTRVER